MSRSSSRLLVPVMFSLIPVPKSLGLLVGKDGAASDTWSWWRWSWPRGERAAGLGPARDGRPPLLQQKPFGPPELKYCAITRCHDLLLKL